MTRQCLPAVLSLLATILCAAPAGRSQTSGGPAAEVDPLIGTANSGNTFPGAVLPFGMVSWSPEELAPGGRAGSPPGGYTYAGSQVRGFSLTHLSGAGCPGSGDFLFMPLTHGVGQSPALDTRAPAYLSQLSHAEEHAAAGFYRVHLKNGVLVELSATLRTGAARFAFPAGQEATLLVRSADNEVDSANASVSIDAQRRVVSGSVTSGDFCGHAQTGYSNSYYTVYFAAHFDHAFERYGTWQDTNVEPGSVSAEGGTSSGATQTTSLPTPGKGSGAYVTFAPGAVVGVRVGLSYVSEANAEANLQAEDPEGTSFSTVREGARVAWNQALGRIAVHGGTAEQRKVFYTALYHSLLHMNLASDVNGEYRGMDQKTHTVASPQKAQYANFSGWDVYRSQVQLVALLYPQVASDMEQSLLNQAEEWGCWSRWTHQTGATNVMNGDPSAAAIAAIVAFGGNNFDVRGAYRSLLDAATHPHEDHRCSRPRLQEWMTQHYLTALPGVRHDSSVADTLEFATADFALAQLARAVGDESSEQELLHRAQYWKNLYNPHATPLQGYLQARSTDGEWKNFDPAAGDGFVEGTGAQYLWMVPFNDRGLFAKMGGNDAANRRLDAFFHDAEGEWALTSGGLHPGLDNEPVLGTPWLYDLSGEPYKTQQTVRAIVDKLWKDRPDGIPGNDDLGEMSSWYVWAALGLYPEIPGRAELLLSSPLFAKAIVRRPGGEIRIVARSDGPSPIFIQGLRVNGQAWHQPWLPASFVHGGGSLVYRLGDRPDRNWGAAPADAPPSFDVP